MNEEEKTQVNSQNNSNKKTVWIYGGILAIAIIVVAGIVVSRNTDNIDENNLPEGASVTVINESQLNGNSPKFSDNEGGTNLAPSPSNDLAYKNGKYSTDGSYISPAGIETIGTVVEIENDTIKSVVVTQNATNPTSVSWQKAFVEGISGEVVGKKIDEIKPSRVNGSSLTPKGFEDALNKIKSEAVIN